MEGLVKQIGGREWEYAWLPTAAVQALVAWLAATLYRPHGKFKQALAHLSQAQQVIDEELRCQGIQVRLAAQIEKKRKVCAVRRHDASLCTQKQPEIVALKAQSGKAQIFCYGSAIRPVAPAIAGSHMMSTPCATSCDCVMASCWLRGHIQGSMSAHIHAA